MISSRGMLTLDTILCLYVVIDALECEVEGVETEVWFIFLGAPHLETLRLFLADCCY